MDCRNTGHMGKCTLTMAADTREEVFEAAFKHAMDVHDEKDDPRLREDIQANIFETEQEPIPV